MIIEKLMNLNLDRPSLDELIELHAGAMSLRPSYAAFGAAEPEYLESAVRGLTREIRNRLEANKDLRMKQIETRLRGLESKDVEVARLTKELAELRGAQPVGA